MHVINVPQPPIPLIWEEWYQFLAEWAGLGIYTHPWPHVVVRIANIYTYHAIAIIYFTLYTLSQTRSTHCSYHCVC